MKKANFFIAGCQKSGSTWLYQCFREHPEIFVPERDAIHYFTINHFRGEDWYADWFKAQKNESIICDPTPSYIRDVGAAEKIHRYNPDAKLLFVLRNPVERSFSHYWHQKRKGRVGYSFSDVLHYHNVGNYDLFQMWIASSFYYSQLQPYLEMFDRKQLHFVLFDDLVSDPHSFLSNIFSYMDVDSAFQPSMLAKKVNAAGTKGKSKNEKASIRKKLSHLFKPKRIDELIDEYSLGIPSNIRRDLGVIFAEEIDNIATLINRDLSHWK